MDDHKGEHLDEQQQRRREEAEHRCIVTNKPGDHDPEGAPPADTPDATEEQEEDAQKT
ncbi:MAG: hypothetical protein KC486_12420 [Myxococcales bacterium]|nr:hypothetical protein [Myxococcales bacterium]